MHRLSACYAAGKGVSEDLTIARQWSRAVAEYDAVQQFIDTYFCAQDIHMAGELKANADHYRQIAQEAIADAREVLKVEEWADVEGKKSEAEASVSPCPEEIMSCLRHKAAKCDEPELQTMLGLHLLKDGSTDEAAKWLLKAADSGSADAQIEIGLCYQRGKGVVVDHRKAAHYFQAAAQQGNARGQQALAVCLVNGRGVPKDLPRAVSLFRRAAECDAVGDSALGKMSLGICYYYGDGVDQDRLQAAYWFQQSAELGHPAAHMWLSRLYSDPEQALQHIENGKQCCQQRRAKISGLLHGDAIVEDFSLLPGMPAQHWALYYAEQTVFYERTVSCKSPCVGMSGGSVGTVVSTNVADFIARNKGIFKRIEWGPQAEYVINRSDAVQRAQIRVGEKGYQLLSKNCEHFVMECLFPDCHVLATSLQAVRFENGAGYLQHQIAKVVNCSPAK